MSLPVPNVGFYSGGGAVPTDRPVELLSVVVADVAPVAVEVAAPVAVVEVPSAIVVLEVR